MPTKEQLLNEYLLAAMDSGKVGMKSPKAGRGGEALMTAAENVLPFVGAAKSALEGDYRNAMIQAGLDVAMPHAVQGAAALGGKALAPLLAGIMSTKPERAIEALAKDSGLLREAVEKGAAPQDEALKIAQRNAAKPVSKGGLGLPPNNTPMDRARAMGFDTNVYHATVVKSANPVEEEFKSLISSKGGKIGPGVYTSFKPNYAERYAEGIGARVIPLMSRGVMAPNQVVDDVSQSVIQQLRKNGSIDVPEWKRATNEELKNLGYAGRDVGEERLVFEPKNLRSRFAAFDPARIDENNLLAGFAALGVAAPMLTSGDSEYAKGGSIDLEREYADGGSAKYSASQAIKDIVGGGLSNLESMARGSVAGLVGGPGDINELVRDTLGLNLFPELPAAPTSERILKAVPRITAPRKESEGMEMLGSFVQPYGETAAVVKQAAKKAAPAARAVAREALERGMESGAIVDPRMQAIAYQGSPHKFDPEKLVRLPTGERVYVGGKFNKLQEVPPGAEVIQDFPLGRIRSEAIGTGEGAQAYGHGSYLAESPEVAQGYRVALSYDPDKMKIGGKQINQVYKAIENKAAKLPPNKASAEYEKLSLIERLMMNRGVDEVMAEAKDLSPATQKWFESEVAPSFETYGSLYTVDIPDKSIAQMLDWDKPLGKQHPEVRKAIEKTKSLLPESALVDLGNDLSLLYGPDVTPNEFLNTWKLLAGNVGAGERALREHGVPGVKYLDADSRGASEGTRNFVVFPGEEESVKILERKKKGGKVSRNSKAMLEQEFRHKQKG